jgi:hypothetical protein
MLWQGAKWRILKNFNVQNEECHNYAFKSTNWSITKYTLMHECSHACENKIIAYIVCPNMTFLLKIHHRDSRLKVN